MSLCNIYINSACSVFAFESRIIPCVSCPQVQQFTNKQIEMSLRVASLDYLGIVAARLRKDAVTSKLNESVVDDIIQHVSIETGAWLGFLSWLT